MKICEAYDMFMREQVFKNNAAATLEYYKAYLGEFLAWLDVDVVEELTINKYKDYVIYLSGCGLKSTSVNTKVRAVKAFYNFLIDEEKIGDCSRKLKLIKQQKEEIIPLNDSEIDRLLGAFDTSDTIQLRNKCIILLMLDSGLRRSEVCRITCGNVDFEQSSVIVNGKGNKQRVVPLGCLSCELMQEYDRRIRSRRPFKRTAPFFVTLSGGAIDINVIQMIFRQLKKSTGIQRLHAHLLRHTFATLYLVDGGNLEVLRCILGHSSISITQIYLHLASNYKLIRELHNSHIDKMHK